MEKEVNIFHHSGSWNLSCVQAYRYNLIIVGHAYFLAVPFKLRVSSKGYAGKSQGWIFSISAVIA